MKRTTRLLDIYWPPSLFIGLGLAASIFSLYYLGHQTIINHPNAFSLLLILFCFLSTDVTKNRNARFFFAITGLMLASFRIWAFFSLNTNDLLLREWSLNPWITDFTILPLSYAIGAFAFFMFQFFEESQEMPKERRLWTGVSCVFIFSFVSIGVLRIFFYSGEGFYLYSLTRIQPYDAICLQLFTAYFIFKSWFTFFRNWQLFKTSLVISTLGGIILATVGAGIERQIYTVVQNQMERKTADIQVALEKNVEERLSIISIFGDFLNTVPNPTEIQIYGMMNKLNSSGMEAPAVLFFNQHYELKWIYRNNKFFWDQEAQQKLFGRRDTLLAYLQQLQFGNKYLTQEGPEGHSVLFSSPLVKNGDLVGYLVFEDLIQPRLQMFFSKNDFGPYELYVNSQNGVPLLDNSPAINPSVYQKASLDYLGEPLELIISPSKELSFNTVFIPQFSFIAIGALLTMVLVYTVYINRKRVLDVEKEVQDRIRDMKVLKEEADRAKLLAEHASYSKSQFLANMSHEIRTPLNVLLGASELLSETKLNRNQKKFVEMFQNSGKHLLGLLNDIIDLSRIESGQLETEKISFDILKTLNFVENLFSLKAQEQGVEFIVNTSGVHNSVRLGDPLRIRQILVNLIGNSFKFTSQGGIKLIVENDGPEIVQFTVEDSGTGIPEEKQKEIFETFQQGDVSFSRKHGGAGLGLAITRNLCQLMGGTIELISKPGVGSKFIVRIPLPITNEAPVKVESQEIEEILADDMNTGTHNHFNTNIDKELDTDLVADPNTKSSPKNVLLVDDSDDNRFLVKLFLNSAQFTVTEAKNGEEAVELAKLKPFDIILMDMQMPVMDGYEAVKIIRQFEEGNGNQAKVPILALTAHGTSLEKNKCLEIGCTDYLSKPVSKNALIHRISDLTAPTNA